MPPVQFFSLLRGQDVLILEDRKNFTKQTYRNRAYILGANGVQQLVVPVEKGKTKKLHKEVRLIYAEDWPRQHRQSIKSAYGRAPFFEHYGYRFEHILQTKYNLLWDLSFNLLNECLRALKLEREVFLASEAPATLLAEANDLVDKFDAKTGSTESALLYQPRPYMQVFSDRFGFVPNLSVIDLVFNVGPGAGELLQNAEY